MDLKKSLQGIAGSLVNAKNMANDLAQKKGSATQMSKSGTGVHSPGSFGVSAEGGAPPASARMAGGVGLQKLAATVIHTGINKYVMPNAEKFMKNIAEDIKQGAAKGVSKKVKGGY